MQGVAFALPLAAAIDVLAVCPIGRGAYEARAAMTDFSCSLPESRMDIGFQVYRKMLEFGIMSGWPMQRMQLIEHYQIA